MTIGELGMDCLPAFLKLVRDKSKSLAMIKAE
jgi:hypothetical protein